MHAIVPTPEMLIENISHFINVHAEPIPTTSPFAQYCVMQLAQKNVTVTLDGQGADEQLGGYHYFFGFYFIFQVFFRFISLLKNAKGFV